VGDGRGERKFIRREQTWGRCHRRVSLHGACRRLNLSGMENNRNAVNRGSDLKMKVQGFWGNAVFVWRCVCVRIRKIAEMEKLRPRLLESMHSRLLGRRRENAKRIILYGRQGKGIKPVIVHIQQRAKKRRCQTRVDRFLASICFIDFPGKSRTPHCGGNKTRLDC